MNLHGFPRQPTPYTSGAGWFFLFRQILIFSNLIYESVGFPPQSHPIWLGGFLPLAVYQTIFLITRFSPLSFLWVRRFFLSTNILQSFPQLSYGARRLSILNKLLVFSPVFLFELGGFLPSTNSHIYTFDRAHAKKKDNCNTMVTRPAITRPLVT